MDVRVGDQEGHDQERTHSRNDESSASVVEFSAILNFRRYYI